MPHIISRPSWYLPDGAATDESAYNNRRTFLKQLGVGGLALAGFSACGPMAEVGAQAGDTSDSPYPEPPSFARNPKFDKVERTITDEAPATMFNNFYEFSYSKDVAPKAKGFVVDPYTLTIDGLVEKPVTLDLEQIEKLGYEERVYRFRCVEAWSMTFPWLGVPLKKVLEKVNIKPEAKYVAFKSVYDPEQMPNQRDTRYNWPYYEGLRIDEAMNELAFVATGMYGKRLPPQNGAPLRVVLPWKYGFKGPKSVVRMTFVDKEPSTFWYDANPNEYPFYSNVDPEVPHPRWSQATEKLITTSVAMSEVKVIETQWYNGYGEYVADLYKDMPRKLV